MLAIRIRPDATVAGLRYGQERLVRVVAQVEPDFRTEHELEAAIEARDLCERDLVTLAEAEALIEGGYADPVQPDIDGFLREIL